MVEHAASTDRRNSYGLVVIGSGPAGVAAAMAYRDEGGQGPIDIVSADEATPYERPPLSKDFLHKQTGAADIELHPSAEYERRDISLRLGDPAVTLDVGARSVVTRSGVRLSYAHCVLATGAEPTLPPVPGIDRPGVHTLRTLDHAHDLRAAAAGASRVVVIGSGFIGCEAAASLARLGLRVTMIATEQKPQQTRLGEWVGARLSDWLRSAGIELISGRQLQAITAADRTLTVHVDTGATFATELVLVAAGADARTALARDAGLRIEDGRVRVDAQMRTSVAGVFAAGDVVRADNTRARRPLSVEHWGDALKMGEIAGANAAGRTAHWSDVPGFWSTIGERTVKYAAWGDGYDQARVVEHSGGGFTVWYGQDGRTVGVLTHAADDDYERGTGLIEQGQPLPG